MGIVLLIILLLVLFGGGIGYGGAQPFHYWGTGYYGGGIGLVLVILLILFLLGRI